MYQNHRYIHAYKTYLQTRKPLPSFFLPRSTEERGESLDSPVAFSVPVLDASGVDARGVSSFGFGSAGFAGVAEGLLVASDGVAATLSFLGRSVEARAASVGASLGASAATLGASGVVDGRGVSSPGFASLGRPTSVASAIFHTLSFTNLYTCYASKAINTGIINSN